MSQAVPVRVGQWRQGAFGATSGELDEHRRHTGFIRGEGGRALACEFSDLVVQRGCDRCENLFRQIIERRVDANHPTGPVESFQQPGGGFHRYVRRDSKCGIVLVDEFDQRCPVPALEKRLVVRSKEHGRFPESLDLLADPSHQVDVRIVVELHRGSECKVSGSDVIVHRRQVPAQLRFARGRQRQQQQRVDT